MSWPFPLNLHSFIWIWALFSWIAMQSFTFYLIYFILSILSHVFFENLNLYPIIKNINFPTTLGGFFFTFYWGFDSFNESPLQWRTSNLNFFVSVSDWHCRTTYLLGRSQDLSPEKAMAPHSSTLAWKIPWMEEPSGLQSMGSLRVGYDWATSLSLFTFMHWRRKWQPTPVFLPGESQGWGSLVGYRLWGHTESDTTEVT